MLVRLRMGGELDDETDPNGITIDPNDVVTEFFYNVEGDEHRLDDGTILEQVQENRESSWLDRLLGHNDSIRSRSAHAALREELVSHVWAQTGGRSTERIDI